MITYAQLTNQGSRSQNEDHINCREGSFGLWCALADGLGGHGRGEVASALAVETVLSMADWSLTNPKEAMETAVQNAQDRLLQEQRKLGAFQEMKTTLVLLSITEEGARWIHVGDSRLYVFLGDRMAKRTKDHSVPQMLVSQGQIRERDIRFHEDRNRLLRVLGTEWDRPKYEISEAQPLKAGISFLLCSDGFWELIDEKDMSRLLKKSKTAQQWLEAMELEVLKNGRGKQMDNYSAISVFVRE